MALLAARIKAFVGHLTSEDLADAEERARGLSTTKDADLNTVRCPFCGLPNMLAAKSCARCSRLIRREDQIKEDKERKAEMRKELVSLLKEQEMAGKS